MRIGAIGSISRCYKKCKVTFFITSRNLRLKDQLAKNMVKFGALEAEIWPPQCASTEANS
jgi:hypothetical protein